MDPLGTDSCRGTVPMEPPMSHGSMRHQNPDLAFDDTRIILQGASYTIAAGRYVPGIAYEGLTLIKIRSR